MKKISEIYNNFFKKRLEVPYIKQINENACGAAVLEMVYKYYGLNNIFQNEIYNKYKEFEPHGSGNTRISVDDIVFDARERNFISFWARADYNNKENSVNLLKLLTVNFKIPIIVCQKFSDEEPLMGHFRIVVGVKDNIIYVHDPSMGNGSAFEKWEIDKFIRFWEPTGENVKGGIFIIIKKI